MEFSLDTTLKNSKARTGTLITGQNRIPTPVFMPVGTVGTVKTVQQKDLIETVQAQLILGNTYHLYLRPGLKLMEEAGGLHRFMGWDRSMLTDSGGFQVYSLANIRQITEEGVTFRSHIDGSEHQFTPEKVVDIQRSIGADYIMAFDECPPYPSSYEYAKNSMTLTHRWLDRCLNQMEKTQPKYGHDQALLPIVQGGAYQDLRAESAEFVASRATSGVAIGGLSVGEPVSTMYEITDFLHEYLPKDQPRYLMGVGTPANILENIHRGVDMFDCVLPTRNARHGLLYTADGIINIKNQKWQHDFTPLNNPPLSYQDTYYSKAYVRHLFYAKEALGPQIATLNNLVFYQWLMEEARNHIQAGDFVEWKEAMMPYLTRKR